MRGKYRSRNTKTHTSEWTLFYYANCVFLKAKGRQYLQLSIGYPIMSTDFQNPEAVEKYLKLGLVSNQVFKKTSFNSPENRVNNTKTLTGFSSFHSDQVYTNSSFKIAQNPSQ